MRILSVLSVVVASLVACSGTGDSGSSSSSTSSSSTSSSGVVHSSTMGGSGSGATSQAGSTSGTATSQAASSSGGASSGPITCTPAPFTLCDGIAADGVDRVLNTTAASGALGVAGLVTVGMTRAEVKAAFGADQERLLPGDGGGASPFPLSVFYCEKRLNIAYTDKADGSGTLTGVLSDDDVVQRITAIGGFAGHTDTNIMVGDARSEIAAAYGTDSSARAEGGIPITGGAQDLYPRLGLVFTHSNNVVTAMGVHRAYTGSASPTHANVPLSLANLRVAGNINASLTSGTSFTSVKTTFGTPDSEGFATVGSNQVAILTYSAAGLRFVGLKDGNDINAQKVLQVYVTPPFAGVDASNVLGIGATRADFAASYEDKGISNLGGVPFTKYKVGSAGILGDKLVGVAFLQDENCAERAAVLVINFIDA